MARKKKEEGIISFSQELDNINGTKLALQQREQTLVEKALRSNDPNTLIQVKKWFDVQKKDETDYKSLLFDPFYTYQSLGYREKPTSIAFQTLRNMYTAPIIKAIIGTRIEQVVNFSEPQTSDTNVGWMIRRKRNLFGEDNKELTDEDKKIIEYIVDFLLNGGTDSNYWDSDSFEDFLRKIVPDSLVLDQMTFEVVRNKVGRPREFFATDGATYRLLDPDRVKNNPEAVEINGFYPKYVQVINEVVEWDFYPWELCFGIRNPTTNIYRNGYGRSELEDLIKIVTWMLYADAYNGKFFSQGAAPKGILKLSGNINEARLQEFKQQWIAQITGVHNAWKTPVLESDKMEWIDLQKTNRDMEFTKWNEYLVKLCCAIYKIDPSEISLPLSGSVNQSSTLFEGNNKVRIEYSQEKGLKPLLKFLQSKINKWIIHPLHPDFEFVFVGVDLEDEDKILESDIKKLSNFEGLKEVRRRRGLPDKIDDDDIILNGIFFQYQAQKNMGGMGSNMALGDLFGGGGGGEEEEQNNTNPYFMSPKDEEGNENPFVKAFDTEVKKLINENGK